jgi:hypothetical protein
VEKFALPSLYATNEVLRHVGEREVTQDEYAAMGRPFILEAARRLDAGLCVRRCMGEARRGRSVCSPRHRGIVGGTVSGVSLGESFH